MFSHIALHRQPGGLQRTLLALAVANTFTVCATKAATITVGNGCSLNEAIISANADNAGGNGCINGSGADLVLLPSSVSFTYSIGYPNTPTNRFTATPFVTSDITIRGNGNAVYRSTTTTNNFRLFAVTGSGNLTLDDMRIGNGRLPHSGGAIYVAQGASLTVNNSRITSSNAIDEHGGGIYSHGGPVTINSSTIINNDSKFGAGVSTRGGVVTISDTDVSFNSATVGGGLFSFLQGKIDIENNSTIRLNFANTGGGVAMESGELNISSSVVSANTASFRGGGLSARQFSLQDSEISMNIATSGAGIFSTAGQGSLIANTTLSGNTAVSGNSGYDLCKDERLLGTEVWRGYGGGILSLNGSPTFLLSTVSNNVADCGGGIATPSTPGSINLGESTVSGNTARMGGGIFISSIGVNSPQLGSINQGTVKDNYARFGAGIHTRSSSIAISSLTASNNTAGFSGGAIQVGWRYNENVSDVTLSNTTLSGNTAGFYGGGLFSLKSEITARNTTVAANISSLLPSGRGGGLGLSDSSLTMTNSIIADSIGSDCFDFNDDLVLNVDQSNIIEDGTCVTQAQAIDPMLSTLADNGGGNLTHELMPSSPALDKGNQVFCASNPVNNVDQRNVTRPIGEQCDIGAVESMFGVSTNFIIIPLGDGRSVTVPL